MVFESFPVWAYELIVQSSYFGVFLITAIANSTIFIGIAGLTYAVIILAVGLGLNPLLVGILAGLGSATGELIGYLVGFGGTVVIEKYERKTPRIVKKLMGFFKNIGFLLILIAAALPVPFDFIGILSGMSKYDIRKFYIATIIGRIIRSLLIAYGFYGLYTIFD